MLRNKSILDMIRLHSAEKKALLAVLLDPDKVDTVGLPKMLETAQNQGVHLLLVGSSQPIQTRLDIFIQNVRRHCSLPVLLFPGSHQQLCHQADALLFLSLISGRNPDYLIGQHVASVPFLEQSNLEIISTGYVLIESGYETSVHRASQTKGIESTDLHLITNTTRAGEWLGMKLIYLEAGSGAKDPVPENVIRAVKSTVQIPVIVGGGINTPEKANLAVCAGADVVVVGNILEKTPSLLREIAHAVNKSSSKSCPV